MDAALAKISKSCCLDALVKFSQLGCLDMVSKLVHQFKAEGQSWMVNLAFTWHEVEDKFGIYTKEWSWYKDTPLVAASRNGHFDVVKFLLREYANPLLKSCPSSDEYENSIEATRNMMKRLEQSIEKIKNGTLQEYDYFYKLEESAINSAMKDYISEIVKLKEVESILSIAEKYWNSKHAMLGARYDGKEDITIRAKSCSNLDGDAKEELIGELDMYDEKENNESIISSYDIDSLISKIKEIKKKKMEEKMEKIMKERQERERKELERKRAQKEAEAKRQMEEKWSNQIAVINGLCLNLAIAENRAVYEEHKAKGRGNDKHKQVGIEDKENHQYFFNGIIDHNVSNHQYNSPYPDAMSCLCGKRAAWACINKRCANCCFSRQCRRHFGTQMLR